MSESDKDAKQRQIHWANLKKVALQIGWKFILPTGPDVYELFTELRKSKTTIDEKIDKAVEALKDASRLVGELEENLEERTQKLTTLRQEVERYSKLAEVEEGNAKSIIQQLELSINKGKGIERWVSFLINIVAGLILFILGLILSPYVTRWLGIG